MRIICIQCSTKFSSLSQVLRSLKHDYGVWRPIHLHLIFEKSTSTSWICNLQKSISKLIFAGYTGSKNPVWNRLKIQFVEIDFFLNQVQMDSAIGLQILKYWTSRLRFYNKDSLKTHLQKLLKTSPKGFSAIKPEMGIL